VGPAEAALASLLEVAAEGAAEGATRSLEVGAEGMTLSLEVAVEVVIRSSELRTNSPIIVS
jgi:hypothetical protein